MKSVFLKMRLGVCSRLGDIRGCNHGKGEREMRTTVQVEFSPTSVLNRSTSYVCITSATRRASHGIYHGREHLGYAG